MRALTWADGMAAVMGEWKVPQKVAWMVVLTDDRPVEMMVASLVDRTV
jgi:hypothetical protein